MLKKFFTFVLAVTAMICLNNNTYAISNADAFSFDEALVDAKFESLDALENVLAQNPEADYNYVASNHAQALAEANFANNNVTPVLPGSPLSKDEPALGISGYIWGACLTWVGILLVYVLLDDASEEFRKAEMKKAVIGCVASTAVWTILYFVGLGTALGWGTI